MRILVLGGGTVGASIARFLCERKHKVMVVDMNPDVVDGINTELDVGVVQGSGSMSNVLFQAGAGTADLCLALMTGDDTNLVAASIAKAMGAKRVVSRVFADIYRDVSTFDYQEHFNIDRLMSIEYLTAMEIARQIREPGSMMIEYFAQGDVEMQEMVIMRESNATGLPLSELKLPEGVRIGSINRDGKISIATAADSINVGDRITILGSRKEIENVKKRFNIAMAVRRYVVIAGGGEIGYHLANVLRNRNYDVRVIEENESRCAFLAERFPRATVVKGDTCRRATLEEENVGQADFFIATTGDDESNIMACVEAMELGAKKTLAVIKRPDYAGVVERLGIDITVSPRKVIERQVEGLLNVGPLVFSNRYLIGGDIHVEELEVQKNSPVTEKVLMDCGFPRQALLASVIRDHIIQVPGAQFQLKEGDTVIALVHQKEVEKLVGLFATPER